MIAIVWNYRRFQRPVEARALRVLVNFYKPSISFLFELKMSNGDVISRKLKGFGFAYVSCYTCPRPFRRYYFMLEVCH